MAVRIAIAGIQGRMGREIAALAASDPAFALVGGWGRRAEATGPESVAVTDSLDELLSQVDVLVDFSSTSGTAALATACAASGTRLVSGVTGLDIDQWATLRSASDHVAIFHAANMSPGVNALMAILPILVRALDTYDLEVVEAHHRYKADAPSGTALAFAKVLANASGGALQQRIRHGREGASLRQPGEIGMHAVRGGGNLGEHAIILASDGEEIRVSHRAFTRAAYAAGALRAARLIHGQPPGWYEPATLPGYL